MTHQPLDPRRVNVCLDANALDRTDPVRATLVDRFSSLVDAGTINVVVGHGVRSEAQHPNTPRAQAALTTGIFMIPTRPTAQEAKLRRDIEAVFQGNARPGRHAADAAHVAEACKYGGYFITHDDRVLKRFGALKTLIPPSLQIVTLGTFLRIYDDFAEAHR